MGSSIIMISRSSRSKSRRKNIPSSHIHSRTPRRRGSCIPPLQYCFQPSLSLSAMNDDNDIPVFEEDDFISELNPTAPKQSQQPHTNNKNRDPIHFQPLHRLHRLLHPFFSTHHHELKMFEKRNLSQPPWFSGLACR